MDRYEEYFQVGCGRGSGGVGHIYIGSPYQKGHGGIGSFLAGVFRRVLPLLTRGARAVGKEALRTGVNIMSDVTTQDTPIRESFRKRVRESGENLKRKAEEKLDKLMEGSGYKRSRLVGPLQLLGSSSTVSRRKSRKKKKKQSKKKSRKLSGVKRGKVKKRLKTKGKKKTKKIRKKKTKKVNRSTRDIFG